MCQVTVVGAIVILLYTSRACYNLVVLALSNKSINSFDYDWYNVSDQVNNAGASFLLKEELNNSTGNVLQGSIYSPATPDGKFPKSFGSVSHIYLVESIESL